jgi:hypothetical protein
MTARSRQDHLEWCKQRAMQELDAGDVYAALASLISDLGKHPDTAHVGGVVAELGTILAAAGHLDTPEKMREWIKGF